MNGVLFFSPLIPVAAADAVTSVVSDSVWPHRGQPTRLPCPWDSPGKNTGVGCHCLLQCMKVKSEREVAQSHLTLRDPMDCSPPGSSVHGIFQARSLEWVDVAFSASYSYFSLFSDLSRRWDWRKGKQLKRHRSSFLSYAFRSPCSTSGLGSCCESTFSLEGNFYKFS